jgi:hypothetical protein
MADNTPTQETCTRRLVTGFRSDLSLYYRRPSLNGGNLFMPRHIIEIAQIIPWFAETDSAHSPFPVNSL